MKDEIREFLISALHKMKYDPATIAGGNSLGPTGVDLDSLAVAEIMVQVEDRFGVRIDEDETERFAMMTIDEIADDVATRLDGQKVPEGA